MELAIGIVSILGSILGLWLWYAKRKDVNEENRQKEIDKLQKQLWEANADGDYASIRNIKRKLNRLRT